MVGWLITELLSAVEGYVLIGIISMHEIYELYQVKGKTVRPDTVLIMFGRVVTLVRFFSRRKTKTSI